MKIKVKQMNGNDFEVELAGEEEACTVTDLLKAVAEVLGIDPERERLIHAGRVSE
jgi:hypothetical protein